MIAYCKVLIDSPLPQLGREFDYIIPEGMDLQIGQPVFVPFGRQSQPKKAVVTAITQHSEYANAEVESVLGDRVLTGEFLDFIKVLAKRQAVSPGELLRFSLTSAPKRKSDDTVDTVVAGDWVLAALGEKSVIKKHRVDVVSPRQKLVSGDPHPLWAIHALRSAFSASGGVIVNLPDHRHIKRLRRLMAKLGIENAVYWADEYKTPSKKYWLQQKLLTAGGILVGTRAVLMMDLINLERIIIVSDLDPSQESETSPYLATREIAYVRADAQQCLVHTICHVPSAENLRLHELGFVDLEITRDVPRVSFGTERQISTQKVISDAVKSGPVLVLTNFAGDSAGVYCSVCNSAGRCKNCGGSIHMPAAESYKCRTCHSTDRPICIACGSKEFKRGQKGVSRTVADYGKTLPGVRVIESSQAKQVEQVDGKALVIATPGAIPDSPAGYQAVIIDQPQVFLSRESLRALEHSLRVFSDAASHLAISGQLHFSNYEGQVAKKFSIGQATEMVREESNQRRMLGLSPWRRLGIVEGDARILATLADNLQFTKVISVNPKLVFSYQYKDGSKVAEVVVKQQLATPPMEGPRRRRGLKVVMDGQGLI